MLNKYDLWKQTKNTFLDFIFSTTREVSLTALGFAIYYHAEINIQPLSEIYMSYPNFLENLTKIIGPFATLNPNFWRWQLSDFGFSLFSVAGIALFLRTSMTLNNMSNAYNKISATIATVGLLLITEHYQEGMFADIPDLLAYAGGISVYWLVEYGVRKLNKNNWSIINAFRSLLSKLRPPRHHR